MRFLEIIRTLRRSSGGPAECLRSNVAGYRALGHTAEILTLDPIGAEGNDLEVPVHRLGRSADGYGYSKAARRWLRENAHRFDGIVLHGLWQYPGLLALQELAGRYSYAVFSHGMLDPWFKRTYRMKHLKKMLYWLGVERRVLSKAKAVLFTSEVEARLAQKSFPLSCWNAIVVPFGTPGSGETREDQQRSMRAFREKAGLLENEPYLLYAGRIHEKKGCDLLVEAYGRVYRDVALPRLVVAGPDCDTLTFQLKARAFRAGVAERILWPGMLEGRLKWGAFQGAEAFILPSHQENFGIAVAEALSVGVPVLISDQVNIHEAISLCSAGYVAEDTLAGTEMLLRRWNITSQEARTQMSAGAKECWRKSFDSVNTAIALTEMWQRPG